MIINSCDCPSVVIRKGDRVIDINGSIGCCVGRISHTINYFFIPTCKGVGISVVRCLCGSVGDYNFCTIVIGLGAQYRSVCILEYYRVFHVCRSELCRISSIALARSNCLIPTDECVGVGFICRFGRCRRNNYRITVVVGIRAQYITIVILENNGIVGVSNIVGCSIGCITCAINYCAIPCLKGVRTNNVRFSRGRSRNGNRITVVIGVAAYNLSVIILEYNGVIDVCRRIGCCVCSRAATSRSYTCIPTCESISIGVVRCSRRIGRNSNSISVMVVLATNCFSVVIFEYDSIFDVGRCVGCGIDCIACTGNYRLIPTCESIGISVIRFSCGISGNDDAIAVVIGLCADHIAVMILKYDCVINVGNIINRCVGCIASTSHYCIIPRLEGISAYKIGFSYRIGRSSNSITIVVCVGADNLTVIILKYNSIFDVSRRVGCSISCIAGTLYYYIVPTGECVGIGIIRYSRRIRRNGYGVAVMIRS